MKFSSLALLRCKLTFKIFELGLIAVQNDFQIFELGLIAVQNDFQISEFGLIAVQIGLVSLPCTSVLFYKNFDLAKAHMLKLCLVVVVVFSGLFGISRAVFCTH